MMYGIYDTKNYCWYGNSEGPLHYENEETAKIAARILDVRFRNPAGQTIVDILPDDLIKKDDVNPELSAEEALDRLENGLEL